MIFDNILFHNVEELEATDKGYVMWRVPKYVRDGLNEKAKTDTTRCCSGVELRFKMKSDTATITLSSIQSGEATVAYIYYGSIQGGWSDSSRVVLGENTKLQINKPENMDYLKEMTREHNLPFDPEVVRVVLPYGRILYVGVEGDIEPPSKADMPSKTYLAYGSSITHGSLALAQPYTYPFRLAQKLGCDYINLGMPGTAHMEAAMAEYILSRKDWDFATVEMGINMVPMENPELFEERIDKFTEILSKEQRTICATSVYAFGRPWQQEMGDIYRAIVEKYAKERLPYFTNGLNILDNKAYISQDMVHPSLEGMEQIVNNWYQILKQESVIK